MTLEVIRDALGWCTIINSGFLLVWWIFIVGAHDWVHRYHSRWLNVSVERFDAIHYQGIALFKTSIILFNLTPYLALRIVG